MTKENVLLVLWMIFGFLFISAIDSILYFIVHVIYFGLSEFGISYKIMKVIIPIITLLLYGFTTFILIQRVNLKSKISGIYLTKFPKNLTILCGIIAFALSPITNKLSGIYGESISGKVNLEMSEYLSFHGWFHTAFGISQLFVILVLFIVFLTFLKKMNNN
ncbi:MAG: hypothetical protein COA50_15635 [Flavobacteriaceae bacterium]|nr:MAG: hypothetical protein COA50_15635 [Flavobacteriaceae bacterium]